MAKFFNRTSPTTAKKTFRIYRDEIAKDRRSFLTYAVFIPLNRLLYVVILPLIFSLIIQSLITQPDNWQHPTWLLGIAVVVSIAALIAAQLGFTRLFLHEERMRSSLLERATNSLMAHSDQFFARRKIGTLSGDAAGFGSSIVSFLDVIFLQVSGIAVNFIASLIIIAVISPILLGPLLFITVLLVWRSFVSTMRRGPLRHERKTKMSKLNGTIADILGNQQIVRFFASEAREAERIVHDQREIERIAAREIVIIQNESIIRQGLLFSFQIVTMAACIWLYANDQVSIAALIFAVTYLGRLTSALFDISPIIRGLEQAFLDAAPITDILDEQPAIIDSKAATSLSINGGQIAFDDVSFAYSDSPNDPIMQHLTLTIPAGQRVGLVGHSGGGKTTLTKLLLRFADATQGTIAIDDQVIAGVTQASLRRAIAYVPQEAYLFHRSLRENIAYGRPDATSEQIQAAIVQANAAEFIDALPEGLETIVGERGIKLSGGQRQRVAIARAILKDAPILVLDEATSALDSESEKLIQDSLEQLMSNRTSIVIAHRLSTIAKLDRIIVLDHGTIIEDGLHTELLKKDGTYAKLWSHQSGGFIEE